MRELRVFGCTGQPAHLVQAWSIGRVQYATLAVKVSFKVDQGGHCVPVTARPLVPEDVYERGDQSRPFIAVAEVAPYLPNANVFVLNAAAPTGGQCRLDVTVGGRCVIAKLVRRAAELGPLGATSLFRRGYLGAQRSAGAGLPLGFDFRFFNPAPPDQQCSFLHGDVGIALEGLPTPASRWRAALTLPTPRVEQLRDGVIETVPIVADTMTIDLAESVVSVIWRGSVPCAEALTVQIVSVPTAPEYAAKVDETLPAAGPRAMVTPFRIGASPAVTPRSAEPRIPATPFDPGFAQRAVSNGAEVSETGELASPYPKLGPSSVPASATAVLRCYVDRPSLPFPAARSSRTQPEDQSVAATPFDPGYCHAPVAHGDDVDTTAELRMPVGLRVPDAPIAEPPRAPVAATPVPSAVAETCEMRLAVKQRLSEGTSLAGMDLRGVNLEGFDLSNQVLSGANLTRAHLAGAVLDGAQLGGCQLERADLTRASLKGARLEKANLAKADLRWARFDGALLEGASLEQAAVDEARFEDASLIDANLRLCTGADASFERAKLDRADLRHAKLPGASFSRASLRQVEGARAEILGGTFDGADLTSASFRPAKLIGADLRGASLSQTDLRGADLTRASLLGVDRSTAKLKGAILVDARLE